MTVLLQAIVASGAGWLLWKIFRTLTKTSPLANIPGPAPDSFIVGHLPRFFDRHAWGMHREMWDKFPGIARIDAFFRAPMLYVWDPKALHYIVVKEQYVYEETINFTHFCSLVFGEGLLSSLGNKHKQQRKILNPVFHTNHMRTMTPTFYGVTRQLRNALESEVKGGKQEIDLLNWMTRTALELVGQGALGYSFDPLDRERTNIVAEHVKSLIPTFVPMFMVFHILPFVQNFGTASFRRRVLELIPWKRLKKALEITDTLEHTSKTILSQKKELLAQGDVAMQHQVGEGKDLMSVLLKANMRAIGEDKMPDDELLGNMSSLIFAAMETTSGALARILQMLSQHQDVQEKLRQEIIAARGDKEEIGYDELMSLPYLEAVCKETLRLHAPATNMIRTAMKDTVLPLGTPIRGKDGKIISEVTIPKGTGVVIGILACNVNPAIWGPDAHEWKPERFMNPLPDTVAEARIPGVYSNLMSFLGGGRACIGFKFSQLEMKIVISVLLEKFRFSPSDKEVYWNFAGVQYPTLGKTSWESGMPLRVELIR
ncbi:cytochrome P450 [Cristinia sonorae]|uniref:Cytochrome P450 n=1 Tax=Cristinia sonorae TaxID=1940300 RepID=A0A8K0XTA8_9AGAR|nr:cytochrome P450 [Cristinia sonorae]